MNPKQIPDLKKYVGNQIKKARLESVPVITQQALAEYLKVQKSTISQYENGINLPDLGTLIDIASRFGGTVDQFLGLDYDPDWFTKPQTNQELAEEVEWIESFRNSLREINSEGRKILKEMVRFVHSRYKRDLEKEQKEVTQEREKEIEARQDLQDMRDIIDSLQSKLDVLEWVELSKVNKILVVKTAEEVNELVKNGLPNGYIKVITEAECQENEEAYQELKHKLLSPRKPLSNKEPDYKIDINVSHLKP